MSSPRSDWSYAPDERAGPTGGSIVTALLALVILALLASGVVGAAVHRSGSGAATTPAGYRRLVDPSDHLSLAVPTRWQVPMLTSNGLSNQIQGLKVANPQVTALADLALATLQKVQLGVFTLDPASGTVLFSYGIDDPGVRRLDEASTANLVDQLNRLGAADVHAMPVHLPLGPAQQVSARISVGAVTVSELLDVLVTRNRVVVIVLAVRAGQRPTSLQHIIESTLAPA